MKQGTGRISVEFIILVALLNAMVAMSIDTMLPAIGQIAQELGAADPNSRSRSILPNAPSSDPRKVAAIAAASAGMLANSSSRVGCTIPGFQY